MATRQSFNALRRQYAGNPALVERLNIAERQGRVISDATGEHRDRLKEMMKRNADELEALIKSTS